MPEREHGVEDPAVKSTGSPAIASGPEKTARSPSELCREIERTLPRDPEDRVKCSHLFGDYFRCNWWSRAADSRSAGDYDWSFLLTDHIRRSSFLKATVVAGQVVIEELHAPTTRRELVQT